MTDVFREVDEEVRRDQWLKLWRAYGNYAVAAVVAFVVLLGGYLAWRDYVAGQARAEGEAFVRAMSLAEGGKLNEAVTAFAALADGAGAGYRALALLQEASARQLNGDAAGAVAAYRRLADDGGVEPLWRDLARLLAALHRLDSGPVDEIERELAPLQAADNPWRFSARELVAALRLRQGDSAAARAAFRQLVDDVEAPAATRARAAELLAALGEGN